MSETVGGGQQGSGGDAQQKDVPNWAQARMDLDEKAKGGDLKATADVSEDHRASRKEKTRERLDKLQEGGVETVEDLIDELHSTGIRTQIRAGAYLEKQSEEKVETLNKLIGADNDNLRVLLLVTNEAAKNNNDNDELKSLLNGFATSHRHLIHLAGEISTADLAKRKNELRDELDRVILERAHLGEQLVNMDGADISLSDFMREFQQPEEKTFEEESASAEELETAAGGSESETELPEDEGGAVAEGAGEEAEETTVETEHEAAQEEVVEEPEEEEKAGKQPVEGVAEADAEEEVDVREEILQGLIDLEESLGEEESKQDEVITRLEGDLDRYTSQLISRLNKEEIEELEREIELIRSELSEIHVDDYVNKDFFLAQKRNLLRQWWGLLRDRGKIETEEPTQEEDSKPTVEESEAESGTQLPEAGGESVVEAEDEQEEKGEEGESSEDLSWIDKL